MALKLDKTELHEVVISTVQNKYAVGRIPKLDGKIVTGVRVVTATESTHSLLGSQNVSDTVLKKSFISFENKNGEQDLSRIPLTQLTMQFNNGDTPEIAEKEINFENSYIEIGETTGVTAGTAFILLFSYKKKS